jgi:hypothetical protein
MNTTTLRRAASGALIVFLVAATPLVAQRGRMGGGNYDPATETTLTGTVEQVLEIPGPSGGPGGLHLMVLSDGALSEIHLGPASYVGSQGFAFTVGDQVTVTGSSVTLGEAVAVIAREVRKGEQVLTLRDERGVPRWSGRGRQPPS